MPYFIHAMSHNLEGNYYEYVVYHPTSPDMRRRLIIEMKLIRYFITFIIPSLLLIFLAVMRAFNRNKSDVINKIK